MSVILLFRLSSISVASISGRLYFRSPLSRLLSTMNCTSLVMTEARNIDIDEKKDGSPSKIRLEKNDRWQWIIARYKRLSHKHHVSILTC